MTVPGLKHYSRRSPHKASQAESCQFAAASLGRKYLQVRKMFKGEQLKEKEKVGTNTFFLQLFFRFFHRDQAFLIVKECQILVVVFDGDGQKVTVTVFLKFAKSWCVCVFLPGS